LPEPFGGSSEVGDLPYATATNRGEKSKAKKWKSRRDFHLLLATGKSTPKSLKCHH